MCSAASRVQLHGDDPAIGRVPARRRQELRSSRRWCAPSCAVGPADRARRRPAPATRFRAAPGGPGWKKANRAAASSRANGMPSSRRQIAVSHRRVRRRNVSSGPIASARATKSCPAGARRRSSALAVAGSGTPSGGTRYSCSPRMRSERPAGRQHRQPLAQDQQLADRRSRTRQMLEVVQGRSGNGSDDGHDSLQRRRPPASMTPSGAGDGAGRAGSRTSARETSATPSG